MILPGATVGVLGGGQLGRMFTLQARAMGYRVMVLDPDGHSPAGSVADCHIQAPYDDAAALDRLSRDCAAVTTEFENVPAESLNYLSQSSLVRPPVTAVATAQDRIAEKQFFQSRGLPTARFQAVRSRAELADALAGIRLPALLKTSRLGYDGKGQALVERESDAADAFTRFEEVSCVLEEKVALQHELSVIVARGADRDIATFPVAENRHQNGILETSVVPARVPESQAREAGELAIAVAEAMDYVGVLGVELFVDQSDRLLLNEMAPRPHNSGHYTMDACSADQFEQQLRALCELPLARPWLMSPVAMINLLGDLWADGEPRWEEALRRPGVRLHLYGKTEARPGRKMGHLNCLADEPGIALATALATRDALRATRS